MNLKLSEEDSKFCYETSQEIAEELFSKIKGQFEERELCIPLPLPVTHIFTYLLMFSLDRCIKQEADYETRLQIMRDWFVMLSDKTLINYEQYLNYFSNKEKH